MDGTDDLIDQILQESSKTNIQYDPTKYTVESVLNEETPKLSTIDNIDKLTNLDALQSEQTKNELTYDTTDLDSLIASSIAPPELKKEEKVEQKKPLKQVEKEEPLVLPKYENPIDLVNFIEIENTQKRIEKSKSSFILQNYKNQCKLRINSLEIEPQSNISKLIYKQKNLVLNAMGAKGDIIITGNTIGEIKFYSLSDQTKTLKVLSDKKLQVQVNCFDFSNDDRYLLVGYNNGAMAFWDIVKDKCKLIMNEIHFKPCIAVKFFKQEDKRFYFFSSDSEGNVFETCIKDYYVMYRVQETKKLLEQPKNPTFLIKLLSFGEEEKKDYPLLINASKGVIFGSLSNVQIYILEPQIKKLWVFNRPDILQNDIGIPDANVGIGKPPISLNIKSDDIKPQLLLGISWGRIIYIFLIPVLKNLLCEPTMLGYFVNARTIMRMGFITNSLIYFFDDTKFIKVINTRQINVGQPKMKDRSIIVPERNNDAQLDDGRIIDPNVQTQFIFEDKDNKPKPSYLNYIVENKKTIHVLGRQTLYNGRLLNWERCLETLKKDTEEEWMDLLTKGIEVFQGRMPALADIPQEEVKRKSLVGNYLKQVISQYVLFNTGAKRTGGFFIEDQDETDKIATCISNTIEFCIEIESFDYLFTTIEPIFDSKDYSDLFLSQLEPFILCDKILNVELNEDIINNIIELYKRKKNYELLSQLLVHLNIKSIDNESIKSKCEEMNLINPLIYIYMNGKEENYFAPVEKLFDLYLKAVEIDSFKGYNEEYEKKKDFKEIRKSKQYLGHKLLWYVRWCLKGKKYPNDKTPMEKEKFSYAISKIAYWILNPKVFTEFVRFDPMNYFSILNELFSTERLYKIIKDAPSNGKIDTPEVLGSFYNNAFKINDLEPLSLIKYLYNQCDVYPEEKIKVLANEFIAKCSKLTAIPKDLAMRTAGYIFTHYKMEKDDKEGMKYVKEPLIKKTDEQLLTLANDLIFLVTGNEEANIYFDEGNYRILLDQSKKTPFDIVTLFLTKKVKEYRLTLELYLDSTKRIPDRLNSMFSWINMTLTKLKEKNKAEYDKMKTDLSNNICKIGKINVNEMYSLVNLWFQKEKKLILVKLEEDKQIQLQYVEILIQKINASLEENENNIEEEEPGETAAVLKLHVQLLCDMKQTQKILPCLMKNPLYPLDDCLQLCLKNKVNDASIYLYQTTGDPTKALKLSLELFTDVYTRIHNNLKLKSQLNENMHTLLLTEIQEKLAKCIEVCEHNEQQNDDLWFTLLDKLYASYGEISAEKKEIADVLMKKSPTIKGKKDEEKEEELKKDKTYKHYAEADLTLSVDIKELLEKMCSFVSIKRIVDKVSESSKEATLREFKELLLKMLNSYSNLTKILDSAKQLLSNSVLINENELIRLSNKGNEIILRKCDHCHKEFKKTSKNENIIVFKCGHLMHESCVADENDELECKICRKNEIESSVATIRSRGSSKISRESDSNNTSTTNFKSDDDEEKSEEKKEMFHKWRAFDKRNLQTKKMLIDNSINLFSDYKAKDTITQSD